ncbi:MAG: hypothetical protein ACTSQJ_10770 [Promethearchaeota archaeon]
MHILKYSNAFTPSNLLISSTILGTSKIPAILIPQRHTNTPTIGNSTSSFPLVCFPDI